jgi:hypothetical protein
LRWDRFRPLDRRPQNDDNDRGGLERMCLEEPEELGDATSRPNGVRIKGSWVKAAVVLAVLAHVLAWVWLFSAPALSDR